MDLLAAVFVSKSHDNSWMRNPPINKQHSQCRQKITINKGFGGRLNNSGNKRWSSRGTKTITTSRSWLQIAECDRPSDLPYVLTSIVTIRPLKKLDVSNKYTRVAYYFDFIAGTSTGGLMASMLTAPNDENNLCLLQKILLSFIKTIVQAPTTVWIFIEVVFYGDSYFRLNEICCGQGPMIVTEKLIPMIVVTDK
ncbi:hypothetical protein SADUNF_Sadunf18G0110700 [Salix dunnii]|uniref:PNPLA domain-containing protein n=1 Tax=Salix dunnii TaxID=1413687 RepID=A0A835J6L1_9ROSI|nr:hypothetical protein SADUNF_Sadunf18G0110700 [Salix dunnii]